MKYLPTTLFKVVVPNHDFRLDFQVTGGTEYVCHLLDSNNEVSVISPLVIDMRLRQGKIRVLRYPAHPSHFMGTIGLDGQTEQCSRCMIKADEEPVQQECPLADRVVMTPQVGPQLEIKDGPGPSSRNHPWRKD